MVASFGMIFMLVMMMGGGGNHLLDYASTDAYWKGKNVTVSVDAMLAELKENKGADITAEIKLLASPDAQARQKAMAKIRQVGPAAMGQLEEIAKLNDPQLSAAARTLIAEISAAMKASDVRVLMAIRTLGELKDPKALPRLRELTNAKPMFVAEYAQRAIAGIEGKEAAVAVPAAEVRMSDALILPAECAAVVQQSTAGRRGESVQQMVKRIELPEEVSRFMDKDRMLQEMTQQVLKIAEQIGDVRIDGVTVGVSGDVGDHSGFVAIIVRGEYDAKTAGTLLRQMKAQPAVEDGIEVLAVGENMVTICPSNDRFVLIAGPKTDALPTKAMAAAIRKGQGTLMTNKQMAGLIQSVDTTQPLWAVVRMTENFKQLPVLAPFEQITAVGKLKDGKIELEAAGKGTDANQVDGAVAWVNNMVQAGLGQLKPQAAKLKLLEPLVAILEGIKCKADGKNATLTATLPADNGMIMMFPWFIGMRARAEVGPVPQQAPVPIEAVPQEAN